jgi:hypothetical protein
MTDFFSGVKNWEFLNEPMWRWFIFIIAFTFMLMTWGAILNYMKD